MSKPQYTVELAVQNYSQHDYSIIVVVKESGKSTCNKPSYTKPIITIPVRKGDRHIEKLLELIALLDTFFKQHCLLYFYENKEEAEIFSNWHLDEQYSMDICLETIQEIRKKYE